MLSSRLLKIAVLGLAAATAGCNREPADKAQPEVAASSDAGSDVLTGAIDRSRKGSAMPEFTLSDAAGKQATLASFKGKPVLLNLWATWCAPCVVELPMLEKLADTRAGELKVLTVSQDMSETEKVAPFLADKGFTRLEPWLDPENELAAKFEVSTLPTTIYFDAQGKEVWRYVGGHDWTSAETARMLDEGT